MSITAKETKRMQQLAHFTIEAAANPVFWVDSEASFQRVKEAACRSVGYTRDELIFIRVYFSNRSGRRSQNIIFFEQAR